jgi:hypothetical protein
VLHRGFGRRPSSAPHHSENKIESIGKADGVFVMQGATAASPYHRTTSNMCHVDGEFTVFLTLPGRAPCSVRRCPACMAPSSTVR